MYILEKLITHNFGILKGTQELYFGDKDIVGIRAEYAADKTRSNRGGKSTIPEAIRYAIDGSSRNKKEIDLIHNGEKVMWVELHLRNIDDDSIKIIKRGRDIKNQGILTLDWIDKVADAQEEIDTLLGTSKEDLSLTNFLKQSDIHGIMDKDPSEKSTLLTKWTTKDHWKHREEQAKVSRDSVKKRLGENEATRLALSKSMEVVEELQLNLDKLIASKEEKTKSRDEVVLRVEKLKASYAVKRKEKQEADAKISQLSNELDEANDTLEELVQNEERLNKLKLRLTEFKKPPEVPSDEEMKLLRSNLAIAEVRHDTQREVIKNIKSLKSIKCPIIKKDCERIDYSPEDLKNDESQLESLFQEFERVEKTLEKKQGYIDENNKYTKLMSDYKSLKTVVDGAQGVRKTVEKLEAELEAAKKSQKEDLVPLVNKIRELNSEIEGYNEGIEDLASDIGSFQHRIKASAEALAKIDEVSRRSEELRAELDELNYIVYMFGKNGIPANEVEYAFKDVEQNINYILDNMKCGFQIAFSPDRELDKWEPACHCGFVFTKGYRKSECEECGAPRAKQRKSEISFDVLENGEESKFEQDSGGGKCFGPDVEILMYSGEKRRAKDIKVGDMLMGPDSLPRRVEKLTSGISKMFKVSPTKGESFTCNGEHMLPLKTTSRSYKHLQGPISVKDYLKQTDGFKQAMKMYRVGVSFNSKPIIDPYLVGLWLGDGFSRANGITIASKEPEIKKWMIDYCDLRGHQYRFEDGQGCQNMFISNNDRKDASGITDINILRKMCLVENGISQEKRKFIPQHFLVTEEAGRLELLAGLMDSDGHLHHGFFEICTKDNQLASDIKFLAGSLGFMVTSRIKEVIQSGRSLYYHRINICGDVARIPTKVKKKIASKRKQIKNPLMTGFEIEEVGVGEFYGFEVSGVDSLILLGDFTVSHNCILSYAVRIAITMLKRDQMKNKLSTIFLDEIDSALDPFFVKQIVASITEVLTKKLGFRQVLIVSHKERVRDTVPNCILVKRYPEGYSEAKFV